MELTIEAKPRVAFGKANKKLRKTGMLPAVLYGPGKESQALEVQARDFEKVYRKAGENTLVDLVVDGKEKKKVLIHEVARHFMAQTPIHVDFYEVDLTRKIHTKVPLHFVGVSPAVKEQGGVLVKSLSEVEIEALPADLPPFIEIDVSKLQAFDEMVRIGDLKLSDKIKLLGHGEEVIVSVQPPRTEEELAELEKPTAEAEKAAVEELAKTEVKGAEAPAGEGEKKDLSAEAPPKGAGKAEEKAEKTKEQK